MTQTTITLDYEQTCCRCDFPIPAGEKAIYAHYYGKRPPDYAHYPTCEDYVNNALREAGYDPDEVGKRMERAAKTALKKISTQPYYGMRGKD